MGKPNVILLTFDALRYDFLGYAGGPAKTPNLDELARQNITFSEAYSTASWTAPSFKGIFTGRYPLEGGGRVSLVEEDTSFPEILQKSGYKTLGLPHHPYLCRFYGFEKGFDVFKDGIDFGNASWTEKLKRKILDSDMGNYIRMAKSIYSRHSCKKLGQIIDELLEEELDEPFFAWLHSLDTHTPFTPPAEHASISRKQSFAIHKARHDFREEKISEEEFEPYLDGLKQLYIDEIEYIDEQVGRLLDELKERGLEDTILILTADHGEEFLEHGHLHHQRFIYEELTHVPLIIKADSEQKAERDDIVSLIDLGPTILDIVGTDSTDLLDPDDSILKETSSTAFMHAAEGDVLSGTNPSPYLTGEKKFGVRHETWHYIQNDADEDELFDIEKDREEQKNLAGTTDIPDSVKGLIRRHRQKIEAEDVLEGVDL